MALQPQQRTMAILGGVFVGGVIIAVLIVSLVNGGDPKHAVDIDPNQPSTSTSTSTTTLPLLTTTFPPITVPPVPPPTTPTPTTATTITPGTTIVIPPPTTTPTTAPPPTSTAPTTPTTKQLSVAGELDALLENVLLGGVPPDDPDAPGLVRVVVRAQVRVTWSLDETLSADEQRVEARLEAAAILQAIQSYARLEDQTIVLRATLPDPGTGDPTRVLRLVFQRDTLDAIDFATIDPLTIFDLADDSDIDPILEPSPATTTTSSSTTTTT
ncbi:MAG: hypothetical protein EXQ79_08025 [Acidimicrobiia bacterium]|nr:hypothetical protein [Acidimicrobiia bacterium]